MGVTKWNPKPIMEAALKLEEQRMGKACAVVQGNIKTLLNKGGGRAHKPSAPGEPPRKQTGRLYGSIFFMVKREENQVYGVIYSNDVKARRLELGFVGRDSLGRTYDQKPRPFMRPGFEKSKTVVAKILGDGK